MFSHFFPLFIRYFNIQSWTQRLANDKHAASHLLATCTLYANLRHTGKTAPNCAHAGKCGEMDAAHTCEGRDVITRMKLQGLQRVSESDAVRVFAGVLLFLCSFIVDIRGWTPHQLSPLSNRTLDRRKVLCLLEGDPGPAASSVEPDPGFSYRYALQSQLQPRINFRSLCEKTHFPLSKGTGETCCTDKAQLIQGVAQKFEAGVEGDAIVEV